MFREFDQNNFLKFYTVDYHNGLSNTDQIKLKDLTYYLNSLDIKLPVTNNKLKKIRNMLSFIESEAIKEYFINMCWIAYSSNRTNSRGFSKFLIDRVNSITTHKPSKKRARMG